MNVYVTGGRQRKRLFTTEEEWNLYERALVLRVDTQTHTSEVCVDYQSPPEVCAADSTPSILFKAGTLKGDKLYLCTSTEVLIYQVPEFRQIGYVSLPCFNDLHHVAPTPEGNLLVANTGLDMVVEFTPEGKVLREWGVLGEDPWQRFFRSVDYRRVATTKPHRSHPNFVFQLGGDLWVTRCDQKDAVCLTRPDERIPIGSVSVHDGHLCGGMIYFTTVDGTVVIVDQETLQVADVIDLKRIDKESQTLLGWCRGLLVLDERRVWVGFTRVRKTVFHEKVNWVKHAFRDKQKPARIALYDIATMKLLQEVDVEQWGMNVVFGLFAAGASAGAGASESATHDTVSRTLPLDQAAASPLQGDQRAE